MSKRRLESEAFSISFLDVITAGFGAIILLLLITKPGNSPVPEAPLAPRADEVTELQTRLFEVRDQAEALKRAIAARRRQLSRWEAKLARLSPQPEKPQRAAQKAALKNQLQLAVQELTAEMRRLQARQRPVESHLIGGIPVDSEYIIFVIDTSGSMFQLAWQRMIDEMAAILDAYPRVKGIQILNDMGNYMFSSYGGQTWIPDTPARRRVIIERLQNWHPFSNSSPVEGIEKAIRAFYRPDRKISVYVLGDDFTGQSIQRVVAEVDRLNPRDHRGVPQIRIHAVGFPVQFANPNQQITGMRFAALMRALTHRNRGAFVGLNHFHP